MLSCSTWVWSPNFLKSRLRCPAKKKDCFWIFMYLLQCHIIFVQLYLTYTDNLNFVDEILCTVLEHAITEMRFKHLRNNMGLFFFKSWEFVCLHRSLSTLSQSHKFRSRCPTLTRSQSLGIFKSWSRGSPNFLNPGVGVSQKMRTPHPWSSSSAVMRMNLVWSDVTVDRERQQTHAALNVNVLALLQTDKMLPRISVTQTNLSHINNILSSLPMSKLLDFRNSNPHHHQHKKYYS